MTETRIRIRWEPGAEDSMTAHFGMVGTCGPFVFKIIKPVMLADRHTLTSELPGQRFSKLDGDPDVLKAEAERWLAEFVASLGAVFGDEPATSRPSRAWHADWTTADRDQDGNAILRHKPTGGLYRVLPVEES